MADPAGAAARAVEQLTDVALEGLPMTSVDRIEADLLAEPATRLVQVEVTKTMLVRLPADEAEVVLAKGVDITDLAERLARWQRIAHHSPHHVYGDLSVSDAADLRLDDWYWPEPVDAVDGRPSYLWSAREFVGRARYELSCGRYHEGHCPDLDEVNTLLGRLEERLRLMAIAVDEAMKAAGF